MKNNCVIWRPKAEWDKTANKIRDVDPHNSDYCYVHKERFDSGEPCPKQGQ